MRVLFRAVRAAIGSAHRTLAWTNFAAMQRAQYAGDNISCEAIAVTDCVTDASIMQCRNVAFGMGDDKLIARRELEALPGLVHDGERVHALTYGRFHARYWIVALTNERILLVRKGVVGAAVHHAIDIAKVTAVDVRWGLMLIATLRITADGHVCRIRGIQRTVAEAFADAANAMIHARA